jgi:hypothetical protein
VRDPFITIRFRQDEASGVDLHLDGAPGLMPLDVGNEAVFGGVDRQRFPFEVIVRVVSRPYPGGSWSEWPKQIWPPRRIPGRFRRWMRRCWFELERQQRAKQRRKEKGGT